MFHWFDSFDLSTIRNITSGATIAAALGGVVVLIFVRKVALRIALIGVLAAAAVGALYYRTRLDDCEERCNCKFINDRIEIDGCLTNRDDEE